MVEYFGEQLSGFAFTVNGWVQSYGSRCVKPPIIYGDVSRPEAMTVFWSSMAQSMTSRPMKGMLTGPVTILNWSFVRNDQPRFENYPTETKLAHFTSSGNCIHLLFIFIATFCILDLRPAIRLLWPSRMRLKILRRLELMLFKLTRLH